MSPLQSLLIAVAWGLVTIAPVQADDQSRTSTGDRSPHAEHRTSLRPVPECPHCRKTDQRAAPNRPVLATQDVVTAPLDPSVRKAQTPGPPEPANATTSDLVPTGAAPPTRDSSAETEPTLPELPADLKESDSPFNSELPNASSSSTDPLILHPEPSTRQMPAPVFLPVDKELEAFLTEPPEPPAPPEPPPAPPTPGVYPFLNSNPASEIAPTTEPVSITAADQGEGPTARIMISPPSTAPLAMPPPSADPLESQSPIERFDEAGHVHSHLNRFSYLPVMIGDQSPISGLMTLASPLQARIPGQPPTPPSPFSRAARPVAIVPWARGFKIADNQSPMPQDRVFYTFDYFNNMNGDINRRLGSPISDMQVYRQLLGVEKTFWRGNASIGVRMPIDTLWTNSASPAWRGNSTSVGDLTVFTKFLLYDNPAQGSLLSGGLAVTAPTGPSSFAGSQAAPGFRSTQIQPFLGYILRRGDYYLQGFSSIDIPTDSRDVTMWYNDLALGYFVYQSEDPSAFLTAVVPTFEVHLNDPLNHRGALRSDDPAGTPDVLDLTFGTSFVLRKRLVATLGCAFPVTGPRPFDVEALALLNFYYGRYGMAQPWPTPPVSR